MAKLDIVWKNCNEVWYYLTKAKNNTSIIKYIAGDSIKGCFPATSNRNVYVEPRRMAGLAIAEDGSAT